MMARTLAAMCNAGGLPELKAFVSAPTAAAASRSMKKEEKKVRKKREGLALSS